jgi:conjugal transfer pilus assembly protein TrbC
MKLMNLFMVMLLLTGRAVLAETPVTDMEWLKQQENLSEQLRQHPDKQLQQELEAQISRNPLPKSDRQFIDNLVSQQKAANQEKPAEGRCTLSPSRYLKRG